jgi:hypothetical protein
VSRKWYSGSHYISKSVEGLMPSDYGLYNTNFSDSSETEKNAFTQNQLHFSTKISPVYLHCTALSTALCGTYKSSGRQVGCDTDQW